jgi:hypothetical protein
MILKVKELVKVENVDEIVPVNNKADKGYKIVQRAKEAWIPPEPFER